MTTVQLNAQTLEIIPGLAYTHEERIAAVEEGLEDIRAGRTFTTEEVFKPYEQWLSSGRSV